MSLGFCGAHRTGKTTLAGIIAMRTGKPFVQTNTSGIFRQNGLDPALPLNFKARIDIQKQILLSYEEIWRWQPGSFITDRTPIDLMAYTLADVQGSTEVNFDELERYMKRCFEVTNEYFDVLVILQPGIELMPAEGKAKLSRAYIEHLNSLILGLCYDGRIECNVMCINREMTDLDTRANKILNVSV
ncbi:MAG TPA: hypothetical protein VNI84_19075 [Pyrinomonadaceae bacterium]|nr:hypothetical protein [Pyrinomonadaceae bacterium]